MKKFLVIGFGNIAQKHIALIQSIEPKSKFFVFRKKIKEEEKGNIIFIKNLKHINKKNVDYILICSPSTTHVEYIKKLSKFKKPIFVEKPLTNDLSKLKKFFKPKDLNKLRILVGYVFRYNDLFMKTLSLVKKEKIRNIRNVVIKSSSFLPYWRKNKDYKKTVSANKKLGGGVLLELSHEIDCIVCLFGVPEKIGAKLFFNKYLKTDVETGVKAILYYKKNFKIDLNLDFHSKNSNLRYFKIFGKNEYIHWNILKNSLIFKKKTKRKKYKIKNRMFRNQMDAFLKNRFYNFKNQYDTSFKILKIIELIKKSHYRKKIINYE